MAQGTLRIQSFDARLSGPVAGVTVTVTGAGMDKTLVTDSEGNGGDILITTPDCSYSLDEDNDTVLPYATVSLTARKEGYRAIEIEGVQIFPDQVSLSQLQMIPSGGEAEIIPDEPTVIPVSTLFTGTGGSGPAPIDDCTEENGSEVLSSVVIPKYVTVHLGKPAAAAQNVTVSFRDYIANVASSEVYPTWPEQALRANIHCQISLALNRVYTEWYRSKGYTYTITNSTSYDQYFVNGRTVFEVMVRLTDDLFNTYVRRTGTVNPYYTEYCDGKTVDCPGLKQWGTVTLANQGRDALSILKYYYGNNIEIVRTTNIQSIPESYPGSPIRQGATGTNVYILQRQLNRIAKDYPGFGTLTVDGVFGSGMAEVVRRFQRQFNLTADGVVGRQTWYKISYIYVSVKDLAELTSEGETSSGTLSDGTWGGTTLRQGSTGSAVQQLQFWLNSLAQYSSSLQSVTVDGIYGAATAAAVRAFQSRYGLAVDGVVGRTTWDAVYAQYRSAQSDNSTTPNAYPGTALRQGSTGDNVRLVQFWLRIARTVYTSLLNVNVDGSYGAATASAVSRFQSYFGLTADGVVGQTTWNKLYEVYNDIANRLLSATLRPGEFPGTLRIGATGTAVRELQFYLYLMSAYESSIPEVTIDGVFGAATQAAVRAYQTFAGLTVDGVVGQNTWNSLYTNASRLRLSGPVLTITRRDYPGTPLQVGDQSDDVLYYSTLINRIAYYFNEVETAGQTSLFNDALRAATVSFQNLEGISPTGQVDAETWAAAEALSLSLLADAPAKDTLAVSNEYPGYAAAEQSVGAHVTRIQHFLNQIAALYCDEPFIDETGVYTAAETARIRRFQQSVGLLATGTVERETWEALRAAAMEE